MKNCNKKILAQYLYDLAKESKSEFIEISKDSELIKIAEKMNLVVPSPDIAILKTIYARTDVPNRNNIVLPKEAAKKALPTLVGKQANWSHLGKNYICGWILDAKLEKDLIVTYIAIYKSLFPEEFEKMKEMVKGNKMAVSFEIWNKDENGNSVLHDLGNGIKSIDPIIYHGVGILIEGETPACKEAYAEKLLATANKKIIDEAEKITNEVFNQDLVFAALVIEEPKCNNCGKCNCIKDKEEKLMIKCEKCGKDFEASAEEKICIECSALPKEEPKTEVKAEETKTQEVPVIAETKPEETKVEETKEVVAEVKPEEKKEGVIAEEKPEVKAQEVQVIEPKIIVKVTSEYFDSYVDTYIDGTPSGVSKHEGHSKKITEYKDGTKDEVESDTSSEIKYTLAELEEKVNATKAEKDAEIATLKAEQERVLEEKDIEIKNKNTELATKEQEIEDLKNPKVDAKIEKEMTVGAVGTKNAYKSVQNQIDERAFGKKK